jgi:endonuclease/exonuclease/phosphatase family metal-dependent hydrolase
LWPRAAATVVIVGAIFAVVVFAGGASATADRQTYLQFNICGNACNHGGLAMAGRLAGTIAMRGPFAVTLNEVCENQYQRLRADLRFYHGRFDPTGPRCSNGYRYGNAILIRTSGVDPVGSWPLPNPAGGETRRLMCLRTRPPGTRSLIVCVTHISYLPAEAPAQIDAVAAILRGLDNREPVLLGGDFNTEPSGTPLDPLYSTCYRAGTGLFEEADSAGCGTRAATEKRQGIDIVNEGTFQQHKLDYIFLSDGHWSSPSADAVRSANGLSDHDAFWATATFHG